MSISTLFKSITNSVSTACSAVDLSLNATSTLISIGASKLESTKQNHEQTQPIIDQMNLASRKADIAEQLNTLRTKFNNDDELTKSYKSIFIDSTSIDTFLTLPKS